jgi:hypothetical protein
MTTGRYGLTAAQHKLGDTKAAVTAKPYGKVALRRLAQQANMPIPAGAMVVG